MQILFLMQLFMGFGKFFYHEKRKRLCGKLLADQLSDPPETADDVMARQRIDPLLHFLPPDNSLDLTFKHDLGKTSHDITEYADAKNYQADGKYLAVGGEIMNLLETHCSEGNDGHVERVEQRPPLDRHIACDAQGNKRKQNHHRYFQMPDRIHSSLFIKSFKPVTSVAGESM